MAADFEVADSTVADTRLAWRGGTSIHVVLAIDDEHRTTVGGVDLVITVQSIVEERLGDGLAVDIAYRSGIAEVGVLHIYLGRFERELLALGIKQIEKTRIFEVLDIVHRGGT